MLFNEWLGTLISYDSKIYKSISTILTSPGKITREYLDGKRQRYTNPFRFMLSLSFIYFLMINFSNPINKDQAGRNDVVRTTLSDTIIIGRHGEKWTSLMNSSNPEEIRKRDSIKINSSFVQRISDYYYLIEHDSLNSYDHLNKTYALPDTFKNAYAYRIGRSLNRVANQPEVFVSQFISRLPFLIFFFLPVFAFFIWLFYSKKRFDYMDHLVFSFHLQSTFLLLLILCWLTEKLFPDFSGEGMAMLLFAPYLFVAMRKFYQQGVLKTTVKFILLNFIFFNLALVSTLFWIFVNALTF